MALRTCDLPGATGPDQRPGWCDQRHHSSTALPIYWLLFSRAVEWGGGDLGTVTADPHPDSLVYLARTPIASLQGPVTSSTL